MAIDLGYTYLETDVHATSDGVLLAFHDDNLQRTCNHPGKISELTYQQIQEVKVEGTEHIPTLQELLTIWPEARWNIDCKSDSALTPLVNIL